MFWSLFVFFALISLNLFCEAIPKQDESTLSFIGVSSKRNNTHSSNHTTHGTTNNVNIDFSLCENECYGHGLNCVLHQDGVYNCECLPGFQGKYCQTWTGCEDQNHCSGHGQCLCDKEKCSCNCTKGWRGDFCDEPVGSQCLNHCSGRGVCRTSDFTCLCDKGYTGDDCSRVKSPSVCPNGCSGQGKCDMESEKCSCLITTTGYDCSNSTNACNSCRHGKCTIQSSSSVPVCECVPPFSGDHCDIYTANKDGCHNNFGYCSGFGVCLGNGTCLCQDGFINPSCSEVRPSENGCIGSCSGHGKCNPFWNECECDEGYTGKDCNTTLCPLANGLVCNERGLCRRNFSSDDQNSYACMCDPCFEGTDCSINTLEKCSKLCNDHGECICQANKNSTRGSIGVCKCNQGWEGDECQFSSDKSNCCPSQCRGNGQCNDCNCECNSGWTGVDCGTSSVQSSVMSEQDAMDVIELVQVGELNRDSMAALWE